MNQTPDTLEDGAITDQASGRSASEPIDRLMARIGLADVVVLIGSSEENDLALKIETIIPGGLFNPERVASHAYAQVLVGMNEDVLAIVRGEPTDATRYRALRDFGALAGTDPERFEKINEGLHAYELAEGLADEATTRKPEDFDRIADFVMQALIETNPAQQAADQDGLDAPAPSIIIAH